MWCPSELGRLIIRRSRRTGGLAARIVRLALAVGVTTFSIAGVVAVISASRLASERGVSRDLLVVQMVEGAIEDRLATAEGMLERVSMLVSSSESQEDAAKGVAVLFAGSRSIFDEMVLADASGRTLAVSPSILRQKSVALLPAFQRALAGASGFVEIEDGDERDRVWVVRSTFSADGTHLVILARMDIRFIAATLERAADVQGNRTVFLIDSGDLLAAVDSEHAPQLSTAEWRSEGEGTGRVWLSLFDGTRVRGYYNDIEGVGNMDWRVVSVKPLSVDIVDVIGAVAPSLTVLILGGLAGVIVAWGASSRLVRPLRELERTARNAAMGAYVKPLTVTDADEIGRVALAFNQVALRLNALHDLSQLLASASRLDQVLDGILSAVAHIVGQGSAAIYLLDSYGERLEPVRTRGLGLSAARSVPLRDHGWLARTLFGSEPAVLTAEPADLIAEVPGLKGDHRSVLAAPLIAGGDVLGLVLVLKDEEVGVSEAEREMVKTFSAQASVAVQTSRLFEVESESRRVAEALREVAQELVRPVELFASLARTREIVADLFNSPSVRILIANREVLGLSPASDDGEAGASESDDLAAVTDVLKVRGGHAQIIERGVDSRVEAMLVDSASALLAIPIGHEDDRGGMLLIMLAHGRIGSESVEVGRALADEIALALDNAYFYERALGRAANLETIFRISQAVGSSLQINVVLNRVLDVVLKILSADAVMLWSYDTRRKTLGTAMVRGAVPASVLHLELGPGEDLPGHIFDSGDPLLMRDLSSAMGGVAGSAASQGLCSLLGVPLLARGRPIGVLMVLSSASDAFTDEETNLLQTFASQAALAIDTARLYSKEHEVASILQASILPEALPEFPELETASAYAPAGADVEIGGDYYDLFRSKSGIWLSVADVCGKGVQAATKTSMIKYAVRAFAAAGLSPARVVSELNDMVVGAGEASDIVTLWVGRYDPQVGRLTWANGGHPPGLLRRADAQLERLSVTGPLLGAMVGVEFKECSTAMAEGDRILLFTDGVTEARRGREFFGDERVVESFMASGSAQDAVQSLLSDVRSFARSDLKDDVAVLSVTALGMQEPRHSAIETVT